MPAENSTQPLPVNDNGDARREARAALNAAVKARHATGALDAARHLLGFGKAADVAVCATAFQALRAELAADAGVRTLKTFIVRSVTVEPLLPALVVEGVLAGYLLEIAVGGYGSYAEELLNPGSELGRSDAQLVVVLLDLEDICGRLPELTANGLGEGVEQELTQSVSSVESMVRAFRASHGGRLVLAGCAMPAVSSLGPVGDANLRWSMPRAVEELNRRLAALALTVTDCVFLDVDSLAAHYGRGGWRDERMFLASRLPIAAGAFRMFAEGLVRTASVLFRAPRKVLCTDLDNTFWGGVLGEDGADGIETGAAFPGNAFLAYQRYLKQLSARGVLLAIVSKNNYADVAEAFKERAADLALTLDDFVAHKISWGEKADALTELAAELSLGLDSFVFVDDNPVELEAVRLRLPEVALVAAPVEQPWRMVSLLAAESFFDQAVVTAEDVDRSDEYKAQARREALSQSSGTRAEFLGSLGIVCTFLSALDAPLSRAVQMLGKTNQFNLTTRRHSAEEVQAIAVAPGGLALAVRVRDRFGDAGVVGLALVKQQGDRCVIDTLLLSCRVIGRGIETAMLAHLAVHEQKVGATALIGEYIKTKKNAPCAEFYPEHGFTEEPGESAGDSTVYRLDLTSTTAAMPAWITVEES